MQDPRDPRVMLIAAKTGHLGPTVFRSTDHGATWREATRPPAFREATSGETARAVERVFWLTPAHASEARVWYAGTSPAGLFRSEDDGDHWEAGVWLQRPPDASAMGRVRHTRWRAPGEHPSITELRDRTVLCTDQDLHAIRTLSPSELQKQLTSPEATSYVIVDVREPDEFAAGHLARALNIPLAELPLRLGEIPSSVTPTFVCRSGVRSQRACAIAVRAGIALPAHLGGGLDAWAREFGGTAIL